MEVMDLLNDWDKLNSFLKTLNKSQLWSLINHEVVKGLDLVSDCEMKDRFLSSLTEDEVRALWSGVDYEDVI